MVSAPLLFTQSLLVCLLMVQAAAKPRKEPTSRDDREHFVDDPERHDVHFDHTAFLGEDRVKEFAKLTPEQSRERLKQIIRRIDKDGDGLLSESELRDWIAEVASSSVAKVTDKRWKDLNPDGKELLSWEDYRENMYGPEEDRMSDPVSGKTYQNVKRMDERRWKLADVNRDDQLSRQEFTAFLHPEDFTHMKEARIDEILDLVDQDGDRLVSRKEYLDDIAGVYKYTITPGSPEPDWLVGEREQFEKYRDTDGDGTLNRVEVGEWIMPSGYDPIDAEVQHLFYHADVDQNKLLTEGEIMEKQEIFVNSQVTNYGTIFNKHEEL